MPADKIVIYSVVVPIYNSENTIVKLINGIINILEAYGELFEIVLVDDCSNDRSWELIKNIAKDNQNIISMQLMRNSGQGSATLAGLESSSGKFVITMDDESITSFTDSKKSIK